MTLLSTFPTTRVLDGFQRADESPLSDGGNWGNPGPGTYASHGAKLVSDQATATANVGGAYWTTSFGANQEAWAVHGSPDTDALYVFCCLSSTPNSFTSSGYYLSHAYSSGDLHLGRIDSGTFTSLVFIDGPSFDSFGLSVVSGLLTAWGETNNVWSVVCSVVDSNYNAGGYIGWGIDDTVDRIATFGGGDAT